MRLSLLSRSTSRSTDRSTSRGDRPRSLAGRATALVVALVALVATSSSATAPSAGAAQVSPGVPAVGPFTHVLLFGDNQHQAPEVAGGQMAGIATALTASGFRVDSVSTLPADVAAYGQLWFVSSYDEPGAAVEDRLVRFVRAGGSVLLTGESTLCCTVVDAVDKRVVDRLVALPRGGLVFGPDPGRRVQYPVNTAVKLGVATGPRRLTTFRTAFGGTVDTAHGIPRRNVVAARGSGLRYASLVVWSAADLVASTGGTGGRLALVMDSDWATRRYGDPVTAPKVAVNLATFLKVPGARP